MCLGSDPRKEADYLTVQRWASRGASPVVFGTVVFLLLLWALQGMAAAAGSDMSAMQMPGQYVGQPVVDDSQLPVQGHEYRVRQGYTVQRAVTGLIKPVAVAYAPDRTVFVALDRTAAGRAGGAQVDLLRVGQDGTATVVTRGMPGVVHAMVYDSGYLYLAMGVSRGEVRRVSAKTGQYSAVLTALAATGVAKPPGAFVGLAQRQGTAGLELLALDTTGAAWLVTRDGAAGWAPSHPATVNRTPATRVGAGAGAAAVEGETRWRRVLLGILLLTGLAALWVRVASRNRL
jgi:hypothetical protein